MKRYESRYCTFAVPDDWVAGPPFAFVGKDAAGSRLTAQVLERCLVKALPAATQLQQQKEILPRIYADFELVSEGPFRPEETGEGFTLSFRFLDDEENESQGQAFHLILGSLFCQLVLACPDRPDRERDRLFAAIAKTFAFQQVEFLGKVSPAALTSETLRTPQPAAARNWSSGWRKFPRACVSLPVPSGWEVVEDDRDAIFRRGSSEIRLHRDLEGHADPGSWFAGRMKQLQASGDLLLGSESGELERGAYAALLYEENGVGRKWRTAAITLTLELFLSDRQPLLWSLKATEIGFSDLRSLFEALVASCEFLDPAEWETRLAEPWVNYMLRGHWEPQGPGVYAELSGKPLVLQVVRSKTNLALSSLKSCITSSLLHGIPVPLESSQEEHLGTWGECEAYYFSTSGLSQSHRSLALNGIWIRAYGLLHSAVVYGNDANRTKTLYQGIIGSLVISGLPK